jgi:hypothetical protein
MAIIVNTIVGEQQLELRNEELLRQMPWGNDWRFIRLGLRWSAQMSATLTNFNMMMGFNAGTTYGYRSANTVEFIGTCVGGVSKSTWTYAAGPPAYWSSNWYRYSYKVGATESITQSSSQTSYGPIAPKRGLMYFDLQKGSGNTLNLVWQTPTNPTTAQTDFTVDQFYRMMEVDYAPTFISGWAISTNAMTSWAYAGTYPFDSVSVSWDNAINPILISDMAVTRFY